RERRRRASPRCRAPPGGGAAPRRRDRGAARAEPDRRWSTPAPGGGTPRRSTSPPARSPAPPARPARRDGAERGRGSAAPRTAWRRASRTAWRRRRRENEACPRARPRRAGPGPCARGSAASGRPCASSTALQVTARVGPAGERAEPVAADDRRPYAVAQLVARLGDLQIRAEAEVERPGRLQRVDEPLRVGAGTGPSQALDEGARGEIALERDEADLRRIHRLAVLAHRREIRIDGRHDLGDD